MGYKYQNYETKNYSISISILLIVAAVLFICVIIMFCRRHQSRCVKYFSKERICFKTWEGIIIQSGFKVNVQSNEFYFSVTNETKQKVREFQGRKLTIIKIFWHFAWRGMSVYVVDSIYEIRTSDSKTSISSQ